MNTSEINKPTALPIRRLLVCAAILLAAVLCAFPLMAWIAISEQGSSALSATIVAAVICFFAGVGGLTCAALIRGANAISGVLAGMIFRMGIPLGAAMLLTEAGGALADAGIFGQILGFYFVVLIVETLLSLRFVDHNTSRSPDSTAQASS